MYRILIVDNEPIIVDGLYSLFQEIEDPDLDIKKAYSASEALGVLGRHKTDIVFADIHMPGMNGLELLRSIRKRYPRCKVIMLTGFNDFEYVQTAIRSGGFDYILKTEGDEKILEVLKKAVQSLKEMEINDSFIYNAREQMNAAKPMLQKEFLLHALEGDKMSAGSLKKKFAELDIALLADHPVFVMVGRVDEWPGNYAGSDYLLIFYAIQNIAQEFYASSIRLATVAYDKNRFVWLVQPTEEADPAVFPSFVQEMLDSIQTVSRTLLKITVSFALPAAWCDWSELSEAFHLLRSVLERGLGLGKEVILTTPQVLEEEAGRFDDRHLRDFRRNIALLESSVEAGDVESFALRCESMLEASLHRQTWYMEAYYSIATLVLTLLNRYDLIRSAEETLVHDLMRIDKHPSCQAAAAYFRRLVQLAIDGRRQEQEERSNDIVHRLHAYIKNHLGEDLSLIRLSSIVYLNPSYLSRLYKQETGHGLSEFIAERRIEKAKMLLLQSDLKVHEIAHSIGLETGYFIKLFKRYVQTTPLEFREQAD